MFLLVTGFLLGVGWASLTPSLAGLPSLLLIAAGFICLAGLMRWQKVWPYLLVAAFLIGSALGVGQVESLLVKLDTTKWMASGGSAGFVGLIVAEPDERDQNIRLVVEPKGEQFKILVQVPPQSKVHYGDTVLVKGTLRRPVNFIADGGKEFDYVSYLKVRGIVYEVAFATVVKLESGGGSALKAKLYAVKNTFTKTLNQLIAEPASSLMAGLILGEHRGLGQKLEENFRRTGLSHIVVLSGYNMMIIAESIMLWFGTILSFGASLALGAVTIILFAMMVGGGPTVARASIMALAALLARATGRQYEAGVALFLAGALMVVVNPLVLVYDVGFQLSFLATLGLIYLAPLLEDKLSFIPKTLGWREVCVTTVAAQLAVLPWLLYVIGEVSLVSLLANVLVLPVIPPVMLFGLVTGLAGLVFYPTAYLFAWLVSLWLRYILLVVNLLAAIPGALLNGIAINLVLVVIIYLGYGLAIYFWTPSKLKTSSLFTIH